MIGLYGGTFDPVHYGHLRTALEVKEAVGLDEIRFIPCREPPHRQAPAASPAQRCKMLELALAQNEPGWVIDSRELRRAGPSYMVDTLASLRAELGHTPLCLIVGLDAFRGLCSWHQWPRLFELAHFIVMHRPGVEPDLPDHLAAEVETRRVSDPRQLERSEAGRVFYVDVVQLDISATQIRQALGTGKSARYLTPDAVLHFIHGEGLYRQYGPAQSLLSE